MITIKSVTDIEKMRVAGRIAAGALAEAERFVSVGVTTKEIDRAVKSFIKKNGAVPSFLGYNGYPASATVSVNEEVIHGIPGSKKLKNGDIVSVDVGALYDGYHGDAARTFIVGTASPLAQRLVDVTRECFFEGLKFARAGVRLYEISAAIQKCAEAAGFSVVRDYVGHGIGRKLHEPPDVPNFFPGGKGRGPILSQGMTLAIEPMVNAGSCEVFVRGDGWTVVTEDGNLSAHYENTVLITKDEPELLTIV